MSNSKKGSGGRQDDRRPFEEAIRTAMRGGDLLVPTTAAELGRFEGELASAPADIPPEVLDPRWLFARGEELSEPARPSAPDCPTVENHAIAARGGNSIPERVSQRMADDCANLAGLPKGDISRCSDADSILEFATATRLREIADLAEWIADDRCPYDEVRPDAIAAAIGLKVLFNDYEDAFDGLLEHRAGKFQIYCNLRRVEGEKTDRARFTLAHELGHYYIDAHRQRLERGESLPLSQCDFESAQPIEQEADHFAAHLLMPSRRFKKLVRGAKRGLDTVLSLRRRFATSVTSTACRYAAISGVPCAVVKWSPNGHVWRVLSPEAREARVGRVIGSASDIPPGAATARALAGESPPSQGFFQTGSTVSDWFRSVARGGHRNSILVEQAVHLGRFGVLTLLFPESGSFGPAF